MNRMFASGEILDIFPIERFNSYRKGRFSVKEQDSDNIRVAELVLAGWGRINNNYETTSIEPVFLHPDNYSIVSLDVLRVMGYTLLKLMG